METSYPVIIGGETVGSLTAVQNGLFTVFETDFPQPESGELLRLSVYGECEGYLGVMEPYGGRVHLSRAFSRLALSRLPKKIVFAGRSGMELPESEPETEQKSEPEAEPQSAEQSDTVWRRMSGGYLMTGSGDEGYLAVPAHAEGVPVEKILSTRVIEGIEYNIFSVKNGKIT